MSVVYAICFVAGLFAFVAVVAAAIMAYFDEKD